MRIEWSKLQDRQYETGLDRGVIYPKSVPSNHSETGQNVTMGSKTFVLDTPMGVKFRVGARLRATFPLDTAWLEGVVTAATATTVTVLIDELFGEIEDDPEDETSMYLSWDLEQGGSAEPWNGLTSVDETGGENAVAYYIDGRPFLHFPKPKEFAATVKAYTYPDALAAMMGLVEVADGMYLDSQIGDVFDLSYRTLVGDGTNGGIKGHKIHLVYNASVVPPQRTSETVSNSINVSDFSFNLQAVPVRIDGYRATAHVVIDTRHMQADRLAQIEELIYGAVGTEPSMPSPQDIFDILSFGGTIIITDNEDGTWDAEGSYKNVYMALDADGEFIIENVDAVSVGDGQFDISSTTV